MPIRGKKQRFTNINISNAPICDGVYGIYKYNELLYIGKGEGKNGIKGRLQAAKRDRRGKEATSFQVERCKDAAWREEQLLKQYKKLHGKLPRYNDRLG